MLVATRATAGPTPRCIECGAEAHFIDLNASWVRSCDCAADLVTSERLDREVLWAQDALKVARARRDTFRRTLRRYRSKGAK